MARVARKDTFMYERVGIQPGDDAEVRRQVFAGALIPDQYVEGEDTEGIEEVDGPPKVGLGAAPQAYKHQLDEHGNVRDEHLEADRERAEANEEALHAHAGGGETRRGGRRTRRQTQEGGEEE